MEREKIIEIVKDAILNTSGDYKPDYEEIHEGSHLHDDLGMDSLDFVEIILYLEKTLNIGLPDEEISDKDNCTVSEIADFLLPKVV